VKLHDLKPAPGAKTRKRRVGRGEAGRRGKTAGRGTKGTGARNKLRPGFEGGQLPIARRIPKLRGFNRPQKEYFALINVGRLGDFPAKSTVGPEELRAAGLVKKRGRVKVLGEGEIPQALTVRAHAFSLGAIEKIQAAGGTAEVIE
jgi:large subunit ribosomal protein L15